MSDETEPKQEMVGIKLSVRTTDGAFDSELTVWPSMLKDGADPVVLAWFKMMEAAVQAAGR